MQERIFILVTLSPDGWEQNLSLARGIIGKKCRIITQSSVYETVEAGSAGTNVVARGPLTQVLEIQTESEPAKLLTFLGHAQDALAGPKSGGFGQKGVGLEILFYGSRTEKAPGLIISHPQSHARMDVLSAMVELYPEFIHPTQKRTVRWLLTYLPKSGAQAKPFKRR